MFEAPRQEYSVKTCSINDQEQLEELLNQMSRDGWDLYTLSEAESPSGGVVYNCIFSREFDEDEQDQGISEVGDFKSKMEKMYKPSNQPYLICKELQRKIQQKQQRISQIKSLIESNDNVIEHEKLNQELSENLKQLRELKSDLSEAIVPEQMYSRINQEKLSIILSDELTDLLHPKHQDDLISQTVKLRQDITDKWGYVMPAIHFTDSETLNANEYSIEIRGMRVFTGVVYQGYSMFYENQEAIKKKPKDTISDFDEITGEKVFWIEDELTRDYWEKGLSPSQVIALHLKEIIFKYINDLLDYNDINHYIEMVAEDNLFLIENLMPDYLSVGEIRSVFGDLLKEKVPVKDLIFIFERFNDFSGENLEKEDLLEKMRIALKKQICKNIADESGQIYTITISDRLEQLIEGIIYEEDEFVQTDHPEIKKITNKIIKIVSESSISSENLALVTLPSIRAELFGILNDIVPGISVITPEEISKEFQYENIAVI